MTRKEGEEEMRRCRRAIKDSKGEKRRGRIVDKERRKRNKKTNKNSDEAADDDLFMETHINYYWLLRTPRSPSANHRAV